ncbi:MAG: 4Fe-4S dicluster domain-containing protein [Veillonellaceae bacterium]|nr:4Fe-4S dicluster domain-containing protein [Veillonellaceae bacterium]
MEKYYHSVRLLGDRCIGCVSCARHCPTEAIRIRGGKARITESRCIDCGECIRYCPNHAKTAVTDSLDDLKIYRYNIALAAPSLYAQFDKNISVTSILAGLQRLGFNKVAEVARGAEIATAALREHLRTPGIKRPVISSACPAAVRLMLVKFPELIDHLSPIDAPVEIAARIARREAVETLGIRPESIGVWFITPCPAKMTAVLEPIGVVQSELTGTISMISIYGELLKEIPRDAASTEPRLASAEGVGWALAGGEATGLGDAKVLVAHGIRNVSNIFEQVALGKLNDVDFIECLSCAGGCIGGPLTPINRFVAENSLKQRLKAMCDRGAQTPAEPVAAAEIALALHEGRTIEPRPALKLDDDIRVAMQKIEQIDETLKRLPGLDCGSCGSPTCRALAEDIVQGTASETDCVFRLREMVRDLAEEMVNLSTMLPPSLNRESVSRENTGTARAERVLSDDKVDKVTDKRG